MHKMMKSEDKLSVRSQRLMEEIKSIMTKKREQNVMKRLLLNRKKPKTKPQGW
ncbi:hypothetical protein ACFQ88_13830 [Paenibacillus sp. NPDC056579]|uniref:hypothetical protein n=1 Tax=unclassified Paenibacillus TaxID=185978 RepID=UPI001EF9A234|nr:hypothetical protein [Paenibacillus sp. H1-7]